VGEADRRRGEGDSKRRNEQRKGRWIVKEREGNRERVKEIKGGSDLE
jgi:hypothetical protein